MGDGAATAALPEATPLGIHPWVAEQERRVRFGVLGPAAVWPTLLTWVQEVERLGFDSFWLGDHPMFGPIDCWTGLAALATRTERLRLGSLVSCVYYRPPALLARQAADVDRLSGGRLVLGMGVGDIPDEFAQLGLAFPPFPARAAALAETVAVVRGLWDGGPVTLAGAYARAAAARLATRPVQAPRVPLLIAGGGERVTLRQVAAYADGCNFGPSDAFGRAWGPPEVRRKLAALRRHCAALGRPYGALLRSHLGGAVAAETETALEAKLAARSDRPRLAEGGRRPGHPRRLTGRYQLPSFEHLAHTLVAGTPAQLVAHYQGLVDAGLRYFILGGSGGIDAETLRLLADAVLPHLRVPAPDGDPPDAAAATGASEHAT